MTYERYDKSMTLAEDGVEATDAAKLMSDTVAEIKAYAANCIAELEGVDGWRLRRAEQAGGAIHQRLLREIQWHRDRSNILEAEVSGLTDKRAILGFGPSAIWGNPELVPEPLRLEKQDFDALVSNTLGLGVFGDLINAMRSAAGGDLGGAWQRYQSASEIGFTRAMQLLSVLVAQGVLTSDQLAAIDAVWPTDAVSEVQS